MSLESELDRLYRALPAAFVGERNALVKSLKAAGDKASADEVAKRVRPSPVAWTVNRLHFEAPELLDALRAAGTALRCAQEEHFDAEEFAVRRRAHQDALRAAVTRAMAFAEGAALSSGAAFERKLESTLNLLGAAAEMTPAPGRMSAELEAMGFDALTAAAPAPPARPRRVEKAAVDDDHVERVAGLKTALDAVAREVRRLEQEADAAESRHTRAARDAEDAAERARITEEARKAARSQADAAQSRLETARGELGDARRVYDELAVRPKP